MKTSFSSAEEAEIFGACLATALVPERATKAMRDIADSARKANTTTTNTLGGFTVGSELSEKAIATAARLAKSSRSFRPRATR